MGTGGEERWNLGIFGEEEFDFHFTYKKRDSGNTSWNKRDVREADKTKEKHGLK